MWKEEGKRVNFFFQFFFSIVEWLGRGGQGYIYMLKGDGRGKGVSFFRKTFLKLLNGYGRGPGFFFWIC